MSQTNSDFDRQERAAFVHDTAGSILTIRIRGEIDHHTATAIRTGVDALLYERRPRKLILDLSAVSFMDSSGLGLIMGRLALIRELGGEMTVFNPGREIRSILTLSGMERMVRIEYPAAPAPDTPPLAGAVPRSRTSTPRTGGSGRRPRRRTAATERSPVGTRKEKDA